MNFEFTEEQKLFAEAVRKFALVELEVDALKRAHNPRFPFDVAQRMSRQGLMGITLPEADGGQGGSLMDAVIGINRWRWCARAAPTWCSRAASAPFALSRNMLRRP